MKEYNLYMLESSIDTKIYVGITSNIESRYKQHIKYGRKHKYYKQNWINSVLNKGGDITMTILFSKLNKEQAVLLEIYTIDLCRKMNFHITNTAKGGLGFDHTGVPHSEEHKRNLEKAQPHKIRIPKDVLYDLYINQKLSKKKIGIIYNCGTTSIHRRLLEYKIPIRETKNYKLSSKTDQTKVVDLYKNTDMHYEDISKELNISVGVVRTILKKNNIQTKKYSKIKGVEKYMDGEYIGFYTFKQLSEDMKKSEHNLYTYMKCHNKCYGYEWKIIYKK